MGVLGALVLLLLQSGKEPSAEIPKEALEQARRRHGRAQARAQPRPDVSKMATEAKAKPPEVAVRKPTPRKPPRKVEARPPVDATPRRPSAFGSATAAASVDSEAEFDTKMDETNRLYDRRDYEGAMTQAKELLSQQPGNVRMLRVIVSSACIMGDEQEASSYFEQLPLRHQRQMQRRCKRYGMELGISE